MNNHPATRPSPAIVHYNDRGLPVSTEFDDVYFNNANGLAESHYVFIQHNDLPQRWQTHSSATFTIAETGFGTGLNFLATWAQFIQVAPATQRLHFVSFEKHPLPRADLLRALAHFPELHAQVTELIAAYPAPHAGCHRMQFAAGRVTLDLWLGDIHEQLPNWLPHAKSTVDAWFLDGFAPDKNPQMWQPNLYQAMAASSRANATFATYTAASAVRHGLEAAGFKVERVKGFNYKRHMLRGQLGQLKRPANTALHETPATPVTLVGGGIATACLAWSLTQRGHHVQLLTTGVADGASGNPQGAVYPLLHAQLSPLTQFYVNAFDHARQFYQSLNADLWHETGVLQLAFNTARAERTQKILDANLYSEEMVRGMSPAQTQQLWSQLPALPALHYPNAGWVHPQQLVQRLLELCGDALTITPCQPITAIAATPHGWQLTAADQQQFTATTLILAAGGGLTKLLEPWRIQLQNVRGQITQVAATEVTAQCPMVLCYKGYFTPTSQGSHCVGATYSRQFNSATYTAAKPADTTENLATLADNLQQPWAQHLQPIADRASLRNTTRDRLPLCGWLTPSLGVLGGLGSRGFTSAPLCAELLVGQWLQEPLPLAADLINRLAPQRLQDAQA